MGKVYSKVLDKTGCIWVPKYGVSDEVLVLEHKHGWKLNEPTTKINKV